MMHPDNDLDRYGLLAKQQEEKQWAREHARDLAMAGIVSRLENRDLPPLVVLELRMILKRVMEEA